MIQTNSFQNSSIAFSVTFDLRHEIWHFSTKTMFLKMILLWTYLLNFYMCSSVLTNFLIERSVFQWNYSFLRSIFNSISNFNITSGINKTIIEKTNFLSRLVGSFFQLRERILPKVLWTCKKLSASVAQLSGFRSRHLPDFYRVFASVICSSVPILFNCLIYTV